MEVGMHACVLGKYVHVCAYVCKSYVYCVYHCSGYSLYFMVIDASIDVIVFYESNRNI